MTLRSRSSAANPRRRATAARLASVIAALAAPATALPQDAPQERIVELIERSAYHYANLRLNAACADLRDAVKLAKKIGWKDAGVVRAFLKLGALDVIACDNPDEARWAFRQALDLDEAATIPADFARPDIQALFERVAEVRRLEVRAGHTPITRAALWKPLPIEVRVDPTAPVAGAVLRARRGTDDAFLEVPMNRQADRFVGVVPRFIAEGKELLYYVEVRDRAGALYGQVGTADAPIRVALVDASQLTVPPLRPAPAPPPPVAAAVPARPPAAAPEAPAPAPTPPRLTPPPRPPVAALPSPQGAAPPAVASRTVTARDPGAVAASAVESRPTEPAAPLAAWGARIAAGTGVGFLAPTRSDFNDHPIGAGLASSPASVTLVGERAISDGFAAALRARIQVVELAVLVQPRLEWRRASSGLAPYVAAGPIVGYANYVVALAPAMPGFDRVAAGPLGVGAAAGVRIGNGRLRFWAEADLDVLFPRLAVSVDIAAGLAIPFGGI